jgi:ATP-dependent Lhr-like helicase
MLDELLSTGEVIWSGQKKLGDDDGLVALHIQEYAAETLIVPHADSAALSSLQQDILAALPTAEPGSPTSSARLLIRTAPQAMRR